MNEIWKSIKGFEGIYEVSSLGNVRSLPHYGFSRHRLSQNRFFEGYPIKPEISTSGRARVSLNRKRFFVHTLVAIAFPEICGFWDKTKDVHHKDFDPLNNNALNLVCLSKEEHRKVHLDNGQFRGSRNPFFGKHHSDKTKTILSKKNSKALDVFLDGEFIATFSSALECEKILHINHFSISKCLTGINKTSQGYTFKYHIV